MKQQLLFLFTLLSLVVKGQVFPVQVTPVVVPPYSVVLSEYSNAFRDQVIVNILLSDISANRDVRLEFSLNSNTGFNVQSTPVVQGALPFRLSGGTLLRLTSADLQPYFELQNLVGINPQQYASPLPDGLYNFCFRVIDQNSGQAISRNSCAQAFIRQNDPPFLNYPEKGISITETNPTNIVFNWTPRHLNATNVKYEFTLTELWDEGIDPQTAFITSPPLYETTTNATTLLYGPTEPSLLPDKTYAWRVRAVVDDGISQTSTFRNNGFSEVWHFKHNGLCRAPQFGLTVPKTATSQIVRWQYGEYAGYKIQYRKVGGSGTTWFEETAASYEEAVTIYNLEKSTSYEYRIGGQCRQGEDFVYGNPQQFTTVNSSEEAGGYQCGALPDITITNQDPLERLGVNETFFAGDFPVTAKFVEQVSTGVYTGIGYVTVPYLADTRILVKFENIAINTDKQLTNGIVETTYDPNWGGVDDISDELAALEELGKNLLNLADAVTEALNLDIDKVTRENTKAIANAIVRNMGDEGLSEELQNDIEEAADNFEKAGVEIADAKESLEQAETTEEKKEAEKQLKEATVNYKEAQSNLSDVNKEVDKEKKAIADLIKKAILELYREGRDNENNYVSEYSNYYDSVIKNVEVGTDFFTIEDVEIDNGIEIDSDIELYYNAEVQLNLYLFSKMLSTSNNEDQLEKFITKSKDFSYDFLKVCNNPTFTESDKIEKLKEQLINVYTEILLKTSL